jgi:hypothetical protein
MNVSVKTPSAGTLPIDHVSITALERELKGTVLTQGSPVGPVSSFAAPAPGT